VGAVILLILFHRYIFFSKQTSLCNFVQPAYKVFKKYYVDIVLILFSFKVLASTSVYEAFTEWDFNYFHRNYLVEIKRVYWFVYVYVTYIIIAGIWYAVGKIYSTK